MNAKTLKEVRLYLGLTQKQLGKRINVSHSYISLMELGEKPVSDKVRIGIAKQFTPDDDFFNTMESAQKLSI